MYLFKDFLSIFLVAIFSSFVIITFVNYGVETPKEATYPFTENVKIEMGADTLHLTTFYLNEEEALSTLHSFLADGYIYTGEYEDIESLIEWSREYPPDVDELRWMESYYRNLIVEKIIY